jgi:hypothetical protein
MKVDSNRPVQARAPRRGNSSGGVKQSGFASHLEAPSATAASASVQAGGGVDSILVLQEVSDATADSAEGKRRGEELLDRLDQIRHGLLLGEIPRHSLHALEAAVIRTRDAVTDPRLREILSEIELRARVELAKLSRAA